MTSVLMRITLAACLALLAGCADLTVNLKYAPQTKIESLTTEVPITIFRFTDARGEEGDNGDVFRVGGVYNGYGMRLAKIMSPTPWPSALVRDLGTAFNERGVTTVLVEDRLYQKGSAVSTPLVLTGEIRNFSTENRWAGFLAHVSGIVRVYDESGAQLSEKSVSARLRPTDEEYKTLSGGQALLESMLNRAVADFVRQVVMDQDLTQRLIVRQIDGARRASTSKPSSPLPEDKSSTQHTTTADVQRRNAAVPPQTPITSAPATPAMAPVPQPAPIRPERSSAPAPAVSPPTTASTPVWIVGSWKILPGRSGSVDGAGSFEFWQENGEVKWRMVRNGWFSSAQITQRASGTVWKASGPAVELVGRYDSSNFGNLVGQSVRHLLTRDGGKLNGYEIVPPDGSRVPLSLERVE